MQPYTGFQPATPPPVAALPMPPTTPPPVAAVPMPPTTPSSSSPLDSVTNGSSADGVTKPVATPAQDPSGSSTATNNSTQGAVAGPAAGGVAYNGCDGHADCSQQVSVSYIEDITNYWVRSTDRVPDALQDGFGNTGQDDTASATAASTTPSATASVTSVADYARSLFHKAVGVVKQMPDDVEQQVSEDVQQPQMPRFTDMLAQLFHGSSSDAAALATHIADVRFGRK